VDWLTIIKQFKYKLKWHEKNKSKIIYYSCQLSIMYCQLKKGWNNGTIQKDSAWN
jgi:hypothetical protein